MAVHVHGACPTGGVYERTPFVDEHRAQFKQRLCGVRGDQGCIDGLGTWAHSQPPDGDGLMVRQSRMASVACVTLPLSSDTPSLTGVRSTAHNDRGISRTRG